MPTLTPQLKTRTSKPAAPAAATAGPRELDAAAVRRRFGLPRRTFARVAGVSERTLAGLEAGGPPSESARRRLAEADRLGRALATVVRPGALGPWLDAPNPAFGGLKPLELVERGESDRLWRMLFDLRSGNPA